ncbi:hypothetical protein IWQ60_005861 [Tieghemiomyces parasiticus]|uniref:YCII-related domain-containing protein n=1 Tax=Tieghemiomyces parasiticus TaxID=78921 RepID=A0A9W8A924_9FUNG|nr:hypothetical protein IWQ60_005861 [Tieghemiomyces parasiticus]
MANLQHYVVIAKDHTDAEAPQRRQAARADHLANARQLKAAGTVVWAGAMVNSDTDPNATMVGSTLVVRAESEAQVREMLAADAYTKSNVWGSFEIYPIKPAALD